MKIMRTVARSVTIAALVAAGTLATNGAASAAGSPDSLKPRVLCPITIVDGVARHVCPPAVKDRLTPEKPCPLTIVNGRVQHVCPTPARDRITLPKPCPLKIVNGRLQHACPTSFKLFRRR